MPYPDDNQENLPQFLIKIKKVRISSSWINQVKIFTETLYVILHAIDVYMGFSVLIEPYNFECSLRVASPRNFARARVYFARPTIAIAKLIRDYSQSSGLVNRSFKKWKALLFLVAATSFKYKPIRSNSRAAGISVPE